MDSTEIEQDNMSTFAVREATFSGWPNAAVRPFMLALAGFFYTGKEQHSDEVTCYVCRLKLKTWDPENSPLTRHKEESPFCEFVRNTLQFKSGDFEETAEQQEQQNNIARTDTSPQYGHQYSGKGSNVGMPILGPKSLLLPSQSHSRLPVPVRIEVRPLFPHSQQDGFTSSTAAMEEKTLQYYQDKNMRVASFYKIDAPWPMNAPITAQEMSEAGLFFTGVKDKVQCAFCRGKLYNWTKGDTAFGEHKRHFPKCPYVMLKLREKEENDKMKTVDEGPGKDSNISKSSPTSSNVANLVATPFDVMQITPVKAVMAMGYSHEVVSSALTRLLHKLNMVDLTAVNVSAIKTESLLDAVFEVEETRYQTASDKTVLNENLQHCVLEPVNPATSPAKLQHPRLSPEKKRSNKVSPSSNPEHSLLSSSVPAKSTKNTKGQKDNLYEKLEEENATLKHQITCRVCLDESVDMLFLPCRHLVCCSSCGNNCKKCPLCRQTIIAAVKTFLA